MAVTVGILSASPRPLGACLVCAQPCPEQDCVSCVLLAAGQGDSLTTAVTTAKDRAPKPFHKPRLGKEGAGMSGDPCHLSIADHAFRQSVVFEDRHRDTALSSSLASTTLKLCDFELFCIFGLMRGLCLQHSRRLADSLSGLLFSYCPHLKNILRHNPSWEAPPPGSGL